MGYYERNCWENYNHDENYAVNWGRRGGVEGQTLEAHGGYNIMQNVGEGQ